MIIQLNLDLIFDVDYKITPGRDAVMYLPNGDPGYPAEPPEIEIISVKWGDIEVLQALSEDDLEIIEDFIADNHDEEDFCADESREKYLRLDEESE
jgi:hypothetical protein